MLGAVVGAAGLGPAARAGHAQQPLSHIPFCSSDSVARALVDRVRFRVAGTDSASRARQAAAGLVAAGPDDVNLVVEDGICIAAASAYARNGGSPGGMPAPFPVAVVRAGDRYVVRLPEAEPNGAEALTLVFDAGFRPLGRFGGGP